MVRRNMGRFLIDEKFHLQKYNKLREHLKLKMFVFRKIKRNFAES